MGNLSTMKTSLGDVTLARAYANLSKIESLNWSRAADRFQAGNETHLLPLSLFVPAAEFYAANLCVGCGVAVGAEMLCYGESRRTLIVAVIDFVLDNLERVLFFSVHTQLDTCGLWFWFNQSERY